MQQTQNLSLRRALLRASRWRPAAMAGAQGAEERVERRAGGEREPRKAAAPTACPAPPLPASLPTLRTCTCHLRPFICGRPSASHVSAGARAPFRSCGQQVDGAGRGRAQGQPRAALQAGRAGGRRGSEAAVVTHAETRRCTCRRRCWLPCTHLLVGKHQDGRVPHERVVHYLLQQERHKGRAGMRGQRRRSCTGYLTCLRATSRRHSALVQRGSQACSPRCWHKRPHSAPACHPPPLLLPPPL